MIGAYNQPVAGSAGQGAAYFRNVSTSSALVTVTVTTPTNAIEQSGSGQSATVGNAFTNPLVATVTDASGNPIMGVPVVFAGPPTGAGVAFAGGFRAVTNARVRRLSASRQMRLVARTWSRPR